MDTQQVRRLRIFFKTLAVACFIGFLLHLLHFTILSNDREKENAQIAAKYMATKLSATMDPESRQIWNNASKSATFCGRPPLQEFARNDANRQVLCAVKYFEGTGLEYHVVLGSVTTKGIGPKQEFIDGQPKLVFYVTSTYNNFWHRYEGEGAENYAFGKWEKLDSPRPKELAGVRDFYLNYKKTE